MAASKSSSSNMTIAAIWLSELISMTLSASVVNSADPPPPTEARVRMRRSPRAAMTTNAVYVIPTSAAARRFAISASRPRLIPSVYDPPAIVDKDVLGKYLRQRIPVAGCEVRRVALGRLACRVFQPPRLTVCLVLEPGMRGVEFGDRGIHVFEVEPDLQARFDPLRRCRISEEIHPAAPQGSHRQCPPPLE